MGKSTSRSPKDKYTPRDHYIEVTNQIIAALEAGTPPWRKPWDTGKAGNPVMPSNAVTGMRYRGINAVTLTTSPMALAAADPRWATYKQAADRGWQVKKGARGTTAYFFKRIEVSDRRQNTEHDEDGKTRYIPLLRAFTLFHASQIESIPEFAPPTAAEAPWRATDAAETIVTRSGVTVRIGGDRAFYALTNDHIQMPPRHVFPSAEGWYSTVLHELGHNAELRIMPRRTYRCFGIGDFPARYARHNQSDSRKASRASSGRYRPALVAGAVTRANAFSLRRRSACT